MIHPCNACDNGKCGSCVSESLVSRGYIRNAHDHCGCAENGHKNKEVVTNRPKVKGMFSPQKEDNIPPPVEREVIDEE